jgi:hypothetical protein
MKKKNKDNEKPVVVPQTGGAPPSTEVPKPTSDERVVFCYNDLIFETYFIADNCRFVKFFVDQESSYFVTFRYGDFIELQLAVWEGKNKILENSKEDEAVCICDVISPQWERLPDDVEIDVKLIDPKTEEIKEIVEYIPIYICYNLLDNIKIGQVCDVIDNKNDKKN